MVREMIVSTKVRFRARREPFPYDMSAENGPVGTSYSFEGIDEDDTKVRVKCSQAQWESLATTQRDTVLTLRLAVFNAKVDGPDGLSFPALAGVKSA
jgi:hypothetical protein